MEANRDGQGFTDGAYLARQYGSPDGLDARIALQTRFSVNRYPWMRWVFDQLEMAPTQRILEVGCGTAQLWAENASRLPFGCGLYLSDLSPGMVQRSRRTLSDHGIQAHFLVADASFLPFQEGSFDMVIANHMLYHVPDRKRALAELSRVLRRGGRLCAATNGPGHMLELTELLRTVTGREHVSPTTPRGEALTPFDLEQGGVELAEFFTNVDLRRYEDGLVVTEADALVAYIDSMQVPGLLESAVLREVLRNSIDREMKRQGGIFRIQKDSGLFLATR